MTDEKKKAIMNCTSFDEILNEEYGAMGTPERMKFENDAEAFCLAETLKEQRRLAGLTTLFRIFAGLGKKVSLTIL